MALHGDVFIRRPMLFMALLKDKGFHLAVGDGCRKLGGHGREMILRKSGNSHLVEKSCKFNNRIAQMRTCGVAEVGSKSRCSVVLCMYRWKGAKKLHNLFTSVVMRQSLSQLPVVSLDDFSLTLTDNTT